MSKTRPPRRTRPARASRHRQRGIPLSTRDSRAFAAAILHPEPPNAALLVAFQQGTLDGANPVS
jgi:hypothetical protein